MTNIEFLDKHNYISKNTERESFDFILELSKQKMAYKYIIARANQILRANKVISLELEYKEKGISIFDMVNYFHKQEKGINDREYQVFIDRIKCIDYQNIAINLFVTGERIKQIESSLIVKLKHKRLLSEFLEIFPTKEG